MSIALLEEFLVFARKKTDDTLNKIAAEPNAVEILAWRPGPGRAPIAWQFMHLGATDDRHVNVRMKGGEPVEPEFVKRFAGGSTPDDETPTVETIRKYLTERREALLAHLRTLTEADLAAKPNEQAPWIYREWFQLLAWHEAHHQGQIHLTLNLYKASQPS